MSTLEARKPLAKEGAWKGYVVAVPWKTSAVPVKVEGVVPVPSDLGGAVPVLMTMGGAVAVAG